MKRDKKHKSVKFKRTPQRLAILEYLEGNTSHPSAEDVYRAVSKKYPTMSFATVYNTLNTMVRHGALRELKIDPERRHFDPDVRPHHHLICLDCKGIEDVWAEIDISLPPAVSAAFTVVDKHVEFHGYCSRCRKRRRH